LSDALNAITKALNTIATELTRTNQLLAQSLPQPPAAPNWSAAVAWRWRSSGGRKWLQAVAQVRAPQLADLHEVDEQKAKLLQNSAFFVAGKPANHVLLSGARGTGKSSLIKAVLQHFAPQGLRLIEVDKDDLIDLPDIVELVQGRAEKFIVYCDDMSFDAGETQYKALKSVLDGSVAATSSNVLVYATSNRRHLLPETMRDNESYQHTPDGELHPGEAVEEKISLSERFGLWLSFYPFSQDEYLHIAAHWLGDFGANSTQIAAARGEALLWALTRGSRSGRVAKQFAQDWAARNT
jgi:hypothetical protein